MNVIIETPLEDRVIYWHPLPKLPETHKDFNFYGAIEHLLMEPSIEPPKD